MMGDPLGSSRVSSQKQNREGVADALFPSLPSTRLFESSLASDFIGTLKLSEFAREQSHDW